VADESDGGEPDEMAVTGLVGEVQSEALLLLATGETGERMEVLAILRVTR
jgi:hypothetical protein